MDYTEIIEREALKYANKKTSVFKKKHIDDFKAGAEYYKQITDIEVVNGKIEDNKDNLEMSKYQGNYKTSLYLETKIEQLEQTRDKLINELKIK